MSDEELINIWQELTDALVKGCKRVCELLNSLAEYDEKYQALGYPYGKTKRGHKQWMKQYYNL